MRIHYPIPKSWQDFEAIARGLFSDIYKSNTFQNNATQGHSQHGVDVYGEDSQGNIVGVQCKGRESRLDKAITISEIKKEVRKARNFRPNLSSLYILSVAKVDPRVQEYIRRLNVFRRSRSFSVYVWGWSNIEDRISDCPTVKAIYLRIFGHWPETLIKAVGATAAAVAAFTSICVFSVYAAIHYYEGSAQRRHQIDGELTKLINEFSSLKRNYISCKDVFADQYVPARNIKNCESLVSAHVSRFNDQRLALGRLLDEKTFNIVDRLLQITREDFRTIAVAREFTQMFEDSLVREFSHMCPDYPERQIDFKRLEDDGRVVIKQQIQAFILLRDFIVPGISSASSYLSVLAGENLGTKTSQLLANEANEIHQILEERSRYQFYDTKTPLTDALVKKYISKDFTASGDTYDIEALRWAQFLPFAPLEALRGREKDVQRLLQCGLLSEDGAKELSKPSQEK